MTLKKARGILNSRDFEETMTSSAFPFPQKSSRKTSLIWLGEVDPEGRLLDPSIKDLAYQKEADLVRYRASEMTDEAEVASLIEEATYRTSKAAGEKALSDPASYLYRTYTNLVDTTLRRTVKLFGMESQVLAQIAKSGSDPEATFVNTLTRQKVVECMMRRDVRFGNGIYSVMNWMTSLQKKVRAPTIWASVFAGQRSGRFEDFTVSPQLIDERQYCCSWMTSNLLVNSAKPCSIFWSRPHYTTIPTHNGSVVRVPISCSGSSRTVNRSI